MPLQGYFFAGRLWNKPALDEMSLYSNNQINLVPVGKKARTVDDDEQSGLVVFSRLLTDWDGAPLAQLIVRNESPVVRELNRSSEQLWVAFCLFAVVLLLLISSSLVRWVSHPLRQIMESLRRGNSQPIDGLCKDGSEFGELARTTKKFFEQRDNLVREMEERRMTEIALRKSEEELRHSQKMEAVGRLAGGVAHDFNNLLTAIIGYAELIATRATSNTLAKQNAELIRKAGEQAAALTRQLLAFSRKQILQPKVIDLNALVVEMEKLLRRVIGERFDLQSHPDAQVGRVKADPSQIEQVVLNLGVNARDAMPRGGKLIIRTQNVRLDQTTAPQISAPVDFTKTLRSPVEKSENFETVLVVEDEEIVRELVCEVLGDQGYNVLCASDGVDALNRAAEFDGTIHLLVTDVIMPQMNGHELASKLSVLRPDMKILYVSGYSDNDIGDHGVLDPRFELLQKPFTPQTLARKIRDVIREGKYAVTAE